MCFHFREKFGSIHSITSLTAVLCGRREPCKPSTFPGGKGCTTLNANTFRPWRNGQKPPEVMKLRLHQAVETKHRVGICGEDD